MLSEPHNPRVAHAFFRAGLIEAWGRGIHQIRERCMKADNPTPLWTREPGGVLRLRFPFSEGPPMPPPAEYRATARRLPKGQRLPQRLPGDGLDGGAFRRSVKTESGGGLGGWAAFVVATRPRAKGRRA